MQFTLGEKKYKIEFAYFLDNGFPYSREKGNCRIYVLEGEIAKQCAYSEFSQVKKGRILDRPHMRKKLLSLAFKQMVPNSLAVQWTREHIQVPFSVVKKAYKLHGVDEEKREAFIEKYIEGQLQKAQKISHVRCYKDACERYNLWRVIKQISPTTVPQVTYPQMKTRAEIGSYVEENYNK